MEKALIGHGFDPERVQGAIEPLLSRSPGPYRQVSAYMGQGFVSYVVISAVQVVS